MNVLIGTTNPAKIKRFTQLLTGCPVRLTTLDALGITEEAPETGSTPEENARQKAAFYGRYADYVICNDSGLYLGGMPMEDPRQPGLKIRSPYGVRLDDEEMIRYYSALVHDLGGRTLACYLDGVAVWNCGQIRSFSESWDTVRQSAAFWMVDTPSDLRHPGWPLDSLSQDRTTGQYFTALAAGRQADRKELIMQGEYGQTMRRFLVDALGPPMDSTSV
jgi:hypothetical protein